MNNLGSVSDAIGILSKYWITATLTFTGRGNRIN